MGKFNIGDRVRVVDAHGGGKVGDIATVTNIQGEYHVLDGLSGGAQGLYGHRLEAAPAWQPKVGDRVRCVKTYPGAFTSGKEYVVAYFDPTEPRLGVKSDDEGVPNGVSAEYFQPAAPVVAPATLTIEAGKFYKTRDGRKVGPMVDFGHKDGYRWCDADLIGDYYSAEGNPQCDGPAYDIIAEWVDEPANDNGPLASLIGKTITVNVASAKPKFKVGDRIKNPKSWSNFYPVSKVEGGKVWIDVSGIGLSYYIAGVDWLIEPGPTAIVALIEDGGPKPSERPFVHETEAAAAKEAARLASKHKGQKFGVFVLTTTSLEEKIYAHEWQRLAAKGEKINAIKELRSVADIGLKPAKDAIEQFLLAA